MQKTNLTHLMARATVLLIAMFCFLGEAKASDVGLYGTWLESVGDTKIEVIKALKPFVNDLQVAKHLVEGAPDYMLRNVTQEEAQACADALNAAGATAYAIKMNAKFLPYEYGFENRDPEGEGWSRVDCINYTKVYGVICNTGDYSFGFSASNNPPQYLISPELVDRTSIRVSFRYRAGNPDYLETFQVGYSTTTNDISAFTWGDEITTNFGDFEQYQKNFPAGTKYVAVRYNSNDQVALYLDDFKFTEAPAPITLPYEYGFENNDLYEEGWSLFNRNINSNIYSYSISFSGECLFKFNFSTNPPQYIISPELMCDTEMKLSFWYRASNENLPETFQVGYSTTTDDISAFTWGDEITASNKQWTQYRKTFPAGTKYVAVRYNSNDQAALLLDDFTFKSYEAPTPKTLPYEYGFENNDLEGEGWRLEDCINNSKIYNTNYSLTGNCFFDFKKSSNPPQYLVSPELICDTEMKVSFWYRAGHEDYPETFQVGYSTTTDDISAFTWDDEITTSNRSYTQYKKNFPAGTKYVAVRYNSNDKFALLLDDFTFKSYEALAPKTLPYEYGFENKDLEGEGWNLVDCDANSRLRAATYYSYSGDCSFEFSASNNPPQYLVSPELICDTEMKLSFWYRAGYEDYPETFQVGYSTTTDDTSAFIWGDEITTSNTSYMQYKNIFPAGTKYVAIRYNSNNQLALFLDDFSFTEAPAPKSLPYEYGFENNDLKGEGWSLVNCVVISEIFEGHCFSGKYAFGFERTSNPPQYLISPELKCNGEMRVSFQYRAGNPDYLETFQVGYSTTTDDISAFTWGNEITTSNIYYSQYKNIFPAGTKYVAVRHNSTDKVSLFFDDFKFSEVGAPKTLPYEYGFENNDLGEEEWSIVDCDNQTPFYPYMRNSGQYSFRFSYETHSPQYLISPELDVSTEMRVSFYYRKKPEHLVTFQVGYSTTTNDVSAFTWGEEITPGIALFIKYINTFPAGTKYVAVRFNSNDTQGELLLDDFKFKEAIAPTPKSLPYEYGFENDDLDEEGWSLVNCDEYSLISSSYDHTYSGYYGFDFHYNTNPPQYLISPELVGSTKMNVSFWYTNINVDYPETFQVGYSTTTNDVSAFTWGDEITASNKKWQWSQYQNTFPAGTKYVAVKHNSYDKLILAVDDFSFTEAAGMKGDVNLDGSVDISDVVLMVNYILGDNSLVNVPLYGDMNDDSSVDISDVVALVNIILGGN